MVLLFVLVGCASLPTQEPGQRDRHTRDADTDNSSPRPAVTTVNQSVAQPATRAYSGEDRNRSDENDPWWDFTLTDALVALFTLVLTIVSIRQFRQMRRQTDRMTRQATLMQQQADLMAGQLTAANDAAEAAKKSASAAEALLALTPDALVLLHQIEMKPVSSALSLDTSIRAIVKNFGNAPASRLLTRATLGFEASNGNIVFYDFKGVPRTLGPQATLALALGRLGTKCTDQHLSSIVSRSALLFVWVRLAYSDARSRTFEREFVGLYEPDHKSFATAELERPIAEWVKERLSGLNSQGPVQGANNGEQDAHS